MNKFRKLIASIALLAVLGTGCTAPTEQNGELGTPESGSQWLNFQAFQGYQTKFDPEKVPDGAAPMGQNTTSNKGDRISIRQNGYDIFPSTAEYSTTSSKIGTMHTFRKRSGASILMRAVSTTIDYYDSETQIWETLQTGYTSDDFGFADNNVNTDQVSYTYFGNSQEPFSRWTGSKTHLDGALVGGETTIPVDSTADFANTGTIVICGATKTYTGKTATSFTGGSAAVACDDNRAVAEAVQTFTGSSYPRGNIYLFADNRLWISGVTTSQQAVYFSGYGTSTDFGSLNSLVSSSTFASAGLFNLAEGGGPVTAMVMDEQSVYVFKRSIIYKATLTDSAYTVEPLKSFDQKSQTIGAVSKRSTFTSSNGVFFVTPDNQVMLLERVEQVDYPQIVPISNIIKPTTDSLFFASSTGIVFRDKAYLAAKTSADTPANDVTLVYNLVEQTWDTPIVGWSVGDWAIYQDDQVEDLYFGDGVTANVYSLTSSPNDYIYDTKASWRTKQYTFDIPSGQKYIENVYVEGYISQNTDLRISLLLDEDGFTQTYSTVLSGSDEQYIYNATEYNVFGLSPFGVRRFGSNEDFSGRKKFRIYLGKDFRQIPFYNAQLEFGSDGQNQQWEIVNYGFLVRQLPVPEKRSLFKAFN